jgi:hypothetical protein
MLGRNVPHDDRAKDEHHRIEQDPFRNHVASSSDPYDPQIRCAAGTAV